jgi:hypothetical protein
LCRASVGESAAVYAKSFSFALIQIPFNKCQIIDFAAEYYCPVTMQRIGWLMRALSKSLFLNHQSAHSIRVGSAGGLIRLVL